MRQRTKTSLEIRFRGWLAGRLRRLLLHVEGPILASQKVWPRVLCSLTEGISEREVAEQLELPRCYVKHALRELRRRRVVFRRKDGLWVDALYYRGEGAR